MINQFLFLEILLTISILYVVISIWKSYSIKTLSTYFLANRSLGFFQLTFTLIATQLGSGLILGTAQQAYTLGIYGICYTLGISLGFIILGCGLAARMRSLNIATTAEIFQTHYQSTTLKLVASLLSMISLWGILLAQIIASKILFLSLGIDNFYALLAFWTFLIVYTMIGGLESIALIDTLQTSAILIIFSLLFLLSLSASLLAKIPVIKGFLSIFPLALPKAATKTGLLTLIKKAQSYYFVKKIPLAKILPTLTMPLLFSFIEQDIAQRFFSAKTKTTATLAALGAGILLILFACIPIYFGMFAKISGVAIPAGTNPLIMLLSSQASSLLFLCAMCAIMAAIASTANSLLSAITSNLVQDFGFLLPTTTHSLWIARLATCLIGSSAVIFSYWITSDIIWVLENSYRLSVICLLIPTMIAYFYKNLYKQAAWMSLICGIAGFYYVLTYSQNLLLQDVIPLSAAALGYLITHILMLFIQKIVYKTN